MQLRAESPQTVVLVLAGGKGTRIAEKTGQLPKCLLPIGNGQHLLGRALEQLSVAQDWQVVVCCSEENHSLLSASHSGSGPNNVHYKACQACPFGPLRALAEVVGSSEATHYLLWLADLYFYANPVPAIQRLSSRMIANGHLVVGDNVACRDGSGSGYVVASGDQIKEICYRAPEAVAPDSALYRWSGLFLFDRFLARDLASHRDNYTDKALETWPNEALKRGFVLAPFVSEPFVNVNTDSDYALIGTSPTAAHGN